MSGPWQVFISYKNLYEDGRPTRDSVLARELFDDLGDRGFEVFFSDESLEALGAGEYKKVIDDALDACAVLVAVGTSAKNLESKWVRYEWDSFFNDILSGIKPDARVFVYVEGVRPHELPRALRQTQVFPHSQESKERLASFISNTVSPVRPPRNAIDPIPPEPRREHDESDRPAGKGVAPLLGPTTGGVLIVDTKPLLGPLGRVLSFGYDPNFTVQNLLNLIYLKMQPNIEPWTYGTSWVLRTQPEFGEPEYLFADLGSLRRATRAIPNLDKRTLKDVGIESGMILEVVTPPGDKS